MDAAAEGACPKEVDEVEEGGEFELVVPIIELGKVALSFTHFIFT